MEKSNKQMVTHLAAPSDNTTEEHNPKSWLLTLDEIEGTDLPLVGGKAFRLAQLRQQGLNVPPGLVLTTCFFESHIKHIKLTPLWMGSPDIAVTTDSLSWLADALKTTPIAKELTAAFNHRLDELFSSKVDSFAVRSSAIDEDQRNHTFAGIHLTELGVPRYVLPIAITRCWASALSRQALEYRQVHGMSIQGISMAILIQPMLKPAIAGVGFSVNPLTGNRDEFIVEATWGLGETLVSGEVQPYFYKLANQPPDYPLLEQQAGNVPPLTTAAEAPPSEPLSAADLTELALQLARIQALMGDAQDVEWAKQDDAFFILQTRPVALPPSQSTQIVNPEWTRGSHPEYLPELPSPLFGSLLERSQNRAIAFFEEIGLKVGDVGPYVKLILGRPYLNLSFLKRAIAQVGIAPGKLLYTIGHLESASIGSALSIDWETAFKARNAYWQVLKRLFNGRRMLRRYQALVDEAATTLDQAEMDEAPATLLSYFRLHARLYTELFSINLGLASVLTAATGIGSSLIAPMTQNPATIITALAQRGVKTTEGELNQHLLALARLAHAAEPTRRYLVEAPDDFCDYTNNPTISADFRQSFEALLLKFGDRAIYEADVGQPRYREAPATLLRIIRQYMQDNDFIHKERQNQAITWQSLTGPATGLNRFIPWRRWLATPFIAIVRRFLVMRDESNSARAKAMAAVRRWDLALGQKWVAQGWLEQAEDIFWLTMDEVEQALIADSTVGVTLSSTVQVRKEIYQSYAETPMPFTLREAEIFAIQLGQGLSTDAASDVMVGLPISPGQVRGTIIVLHSPDDFKTIIDDAILVMPTTDPAWLPLLHRAAGLIVEMGGLLSHGSVIAREYGVPGVANIPDATKRFHNGEVVLLDGSTGVVQRLEGVGSILSEES